MVVEAGENVVKLRRTELNLTQQEAARRADVSLATWRRFENAAMDVDALDGFRGDNVHGFARALKLTAGGLRQLITDGVAATGGAELVVDRATAELVELYNSSFTGDPLTPVDAMALANTVDFSDFAPSRDGELRLDDAFSESFAAYLKGEVTIRDVDLLRDLPELALTQVNNHWLVRMGERIMRIAAELNEGRIPRVQCLADEYALWIVILNTEPPQLGDVNALFPGLRTAEDIFGYDPDVDDPDDDAAIREEWMNRMAGGLLPSEHDHDHRRYDLLIMETYGQGVYDVADPRHPARWFDRDDLRQRAESELAFVRLPKEDQEARTAEALSRMDALFSATTNETP